MTAVYEYLFGMDSLIVRYKHHDVVITPGQKVHVRSERLETWCFDGIVKSVFKTGVVVTYGNDTYFGLLALTRGNTKFIPLDKITTHLRFPAPRILKSVDRQDLVREDQGRLPS